MMEFLRTKASLKDTKRAYSLVFGLLSALIVMTISMSAVSDRLEVIENGASASIFYECGDSLREYSSAQRDDDRISSALRFRNAVSKLDCGEELMHSLSDYAGRLRYGSVDYPDAVLLSDEFFALAAGSGDPDECLGRYFPVSGVSDPAAPEIPERFVTAAVKSTANILLDGVNGLPRLLREEKWYIMKADNLRLKFSPADGDLIDMFFLREGSLSGGADDGFILSAALSKADELGTDISDASVSGGICGLRTVDVDGRHERFRFVYDGRGRLIAVKRD